VVIVYNHILSIEKERRTIWANSNAKWHSKISFIINRYSSEAVIAYVVYSEFHVMYLGRWVWAVFPSCWRKQFQVEYTSESPLDLCECGIKGNIYTRRTHSHVAHFNGSLTQKQSCQRFIWVFGMVSIVFGAISHCKFISLPLIDLDCISSRNSSAHIRPLGPQKKDRPNSDNCFCVVHLDHHNSRNILCPSTSM
jgi:hypothetical protein